MDNSYKTSGGLIHLIAEQDEASLQQMEGLAQEVDYLFTQLLYLPPDRRDYNSSAQKYLSVEVKLNALKMRQESRVMNELTIKQVDIVITLWDQDRKRHQRQNSFSDFMIKRYRSQYIRLFLAMIKGEEVKEKRLES
jgi:putative lipoic acid-binding regulatory protein